MDGLRRMSVQEASNASLGLGGGIAVSNNASHTGDFVAIYFKSSTVFSSLTCNITGADMTAWTFSQGEWLFGRITEFALASGNVIAYSGDV